jgi:hypothetical protein
MIELRYGDALESLRDIHVLLAPTKNGTDRRRMNLELSE